MYKRKQKTPDFMKSLIKDFTSDTDAGIADPITFIEANWGLNLKLLPSQKFIIKCLYSMPFSEEKYIPVPSITNEEILYTFNDQEFLDWLYENKMCNTNTTVNEDGTPKCFRELILSCGRRAGKSTLSSAISNYEIYRLIKRSDPVKHYNAAPGSKISILNVAPTGDQASILFDLIKNTASKCNFLKERLLNQTQSYFYVKTDADVANSEITGKINPSIASFAGGCSSNSIRGHAALVVIMDEFAFFLDNGGKMSAEEVYKALTPSTATFNDGKIILLSSPYGKFGHFYKRYTQSFDEEDRTLMFRMYSSLVNPTIDSGYLKAERKRDKSGFLSEYGAEFSDSVVAWVDDEEQFKKCVNIGKRQEFRGKTGVRYYMGLDLAFKNDATAVAICHKENNKIILDYADAWFSGVSDVWEMENSIYHRFNKYAHKDILRMSDIVDELIDLHNRFPIEKGMYDQSNGFGLQELIGNVGLNQIEMRHFSDAMNHNVFEVLKNLYQEDLIELFDDKSIISEMLMLEGEKRAKGRVHVRAPNRRGAHDDLSDAIARAIFLCATEGTDMVKSVRGIPKAQNAKSVNHYRLQQLRKFGRNPRDTKPLRRKAGQVIIPKSVRRDR